MKRYFLLITFSFLFCNISVAGTGKGDLKLTESGLRGFYAYITNPGGKTRGTAKPLRMVVSHDGSYVHWFVCRYAQCTSNGFTELEKICENRSIVNNNMKAYYKNKKLVCTYRLKKGIAKVNGGVEVLKKLDYKKEIIDDAINYN